jgi:hypothetical protein
VGRGTGAGIAPNTGWAKVAADTPRRRPIIPPVSSPVTLLSCIEPEDQVRFARDFVAKRCVRVQEFDGALTKINARGPLVVRQRRGKLRPPSRGIRIAPTHLGEPRPDEAVS